MFRPRREFAGTAAIMKTLILRPTLFTTCGSACSVLVQKKVFFQYFWLPTSFILSFIFWFGWIFLPPVMFLVALIRYHIFDLGWLSTTCTAWSATTSSFKMPFLEVRRNAGSNLCYNINTNTGMRLFPLVIHSNIVQNIFSQRKIFFSQRKLVSPLKLQ